MLALFGFLIIVTDNKEHILSWFGHGFGRKGIGWTPPNKDAFRLVYFTA